MSLYHVLAAVGDVGDDHRSLGVFEARSAREALDRCLAEHEREQELRRVPPELVEIARVEHERLWRQLAELDAYFIVVPVAAEVHFVRDHAGVVGEAADGERRRSIMRREFGVDVV